MFICPSFWHGFLHPAFASRWNDSSKSTFEEGLSVVNFPRTWLNFPRSVCGYWALERWRVYSEMCWHVKCTLNFKNVILTHAPPPQKTVLLVSPDMPASLIVLCKFLLLVFVTKKVMNFLGHCMRCASRGLWAGPLRAETGAAIDGRQIIQNGFSVTLAFWEIF